MILKYFYKKDFFYFFLQLSKKFMKVIVALAIQSHSLSLLIGVYLYSVQYMCKNAHELNFRKKYI